MGNTYFYVRAVKMAFEEQVAICSEGVEATTSNRKEHQIVHKTIFILTISKAVTTLNYLAINSILTNLEFFIWYE